MARYIRPSSWKDSHYFPLRLLTTMQLLLVFFALLFLSTLGVMIEPNSTYTITNGKATMSVLDLSGADNKTSALKSSPLLAHDIKRVHQSLAILDTAAATKRSGVLCKKYFLKDPLLTPCSSYSGPLLITKAPGRLCLILRNCTWLQRRLPLSTGRSLSPQANRLFGIFIQTARMPATISMDFMGLLITHPCSCHLRFYATKTAYVIDLSDFGNSTPGAAIQLWKDHNGTHQAWSLECESRNRRSVLETHNRVAESCAVLIYDAANEVTTFMLLRVHLDGSSHLRIVTHVCLSVSNHQLCHCTCFKKHWAKLWVGRFTVPEDPPPE